MKASAKGVMVIPGKTESTVAVKMLKGIAMMMIMFLAYAKE